MRFSRVWSALAHAVVRLSKAMLTRYDKLLITGLLSAAILALGIVRYRAAEPKAVVVQMDGEEMIRASLAEDRRFCVDGPLGRTEIEVKDRRVRVVDSPCGRKTCVYTGWIDKPYQTIICMPNRVMIRLLGGDSRDELDGITE